MDTGISGRPWRQEPVAVVCEEVPGELKEGVVYVKTGNSSEALGVMASNFYGNPSHRMKVVGVTGTNGKTTTATLLYELVRLLGRKAGLLSTVCNYIGDERVHATHTTPGRDGDERADGADGGCRVRVLFHGGEFARY